MVGAIESAGAIAALTAVVCGTAALGLEPQEIERFLRRENVRKVSARDLGVAMAKRADGATTVAGTLAIASVAGVRVMATGGIGGVHREIPGTPAHQLVRDESADLQELARAAMIVVCSGAKSILDLPATWERLDTLGIPVIGFGTDAFPAFFTRSSGITLDVRADSAEEVASIASAHFGLGRRQSVLVVQPPPANVAVDAETVERAVERALDRAHRDGIKGSEVTPYLLDAVARETGGHTLQANLSLLEANARLAAQLAVTLSAKV
jgi:pseudouridine-5'-phosphate glycosidase